MSTIEIHTLKLSTIELQTQKQSVLSGPLGRNACYIINFMASGSNGEVKRGDIFKPDLGRSE